MERIERHVSHGGSQEVWKHASSTVGGDMKFGIYLPEAALRGQKCPVLYWLSGLTCTEQNFITKAGVQRYAAEHGIIVVAPDTSPRGSDVPDSPDYDLGQGAGFYVNATREPWAKHFRMYDYVVSELPAVVDRARCRGARRRSPPTSATTARRGNSMTPWSWSAARANACRYSSNKAAATNSSIPSYGRNCCRRPAQRRDNR